MNKKKSVEDLLEEIIKKLDRLIAIQMIQGRDVGIQISVLKELGYGWNEIGNFVGMKPDAVRMRYSRKSD